MQHAQHGGPEMGPPGPIAFCLRLRAAALPGRWVGSCWRRSTGHPARPAADRRAPDQFCLFPISRQPVPAMSSGGVAALRSGAGALAAPCEASPSVDGPLDLWRPPCVDIGALAAAPDGAERLAAAISAAPQGVLLLANALPAPFEAIDELFGRVTPQAGARANAGAHAAVATDGCIFPVLQPALRSAACFVQLVSCCADRPSLHLHLPAAYQAGTSRLVWKDAHGEGRWLLHAHVQSSANGAARCRGGAQ